LSGLFVANLKTLLLHIAELWIDFCSRSGMCGSLNSHVSGMLIGFTSLCVRSHRYQPRIDFEVEASTALPPTSSASLLLSGLSNATAAYGWQDISTELGLRGDKSWAMAEGLLTLRGRAAWAHD
jgi:hypothetical protein